MRAGREWGQRSPLWVHQLETADIERFDVLARNVHSSHLHSPPLPLSYGVGKGCVKQVWSIGCIDRMDTSGRLSAGYASNMSVTIELP
jgi:hypothetical protein